MLPGYKLPMVFDAGLLKADLKGVAPEQWVRHFNKGYYEGEWKGVALRSPTGRANQLHRPHDHASPAIDTAVLAGCHYFREVLNAFKCPILTARLLSLSPGSKILEHQDYFLGVEDGLLRLHIPVVTAPSVEFFLAGQRLTMMEGETWYLDLSLPHRVSNYSDKDRVHLVIDCAVNEWLVALIPFAGRAHGA